MAPPSSAKRTKGESLEPERQILRRTRWAEALYALLATLMSLSLPWPPPAGLRLAWFHWTATAVMAAVLVFWLRRPSRGAWYAAAGLSAYVWINSFWLVIAVRNLRQGDSRALLSTALFLLPWLVQLVVAVACWRSRALRQGARVGELARVP